MKVCFVVAEAVEITAANMVRTITSVLAAAALSVVLTGTFVNADIYMHNPRGSNDRNCEVRLDLTSSLGLMCMSTLQRDLKQPCFTFISCTAQR